MSQQPEPAPPAPHERPEAVTAPNAQTPVAAESIDEGAGKDSLPEAASNKEKAVFQQGGVNLNAEKLEADKIYAAERIDIQQYIIGRHDSAPLKPFSPDFLTPISLEAEWELMETHVCDPVLSEELYATLCEKHLLVLTGGPETGKTTTALYLGNRLRQVSDSFNGVYLVRPLDRNVKIDFRELMEGREEFSRRLLLFRDAFAGGNLDLLEFFTQMGKPTLGSITEKLRRNQLFLVFTADTETIKNCQRQLSALSIEGCIPPLGDALLLSGLDLKLKQFAEMQNNEALKDRLTPAQREEVVKSLRTMPRISNFVEHYLLKLGEGLELGEAIRRVDNLEDWFLSDLTDNFDVWCFALTLGLCQCLPYSPGVPWFEFEYFRETISNHLRRKLRADWLAQPKTSLKDSISERLLLERCRAEIYKDPATGVDAVKFVNERYPEMLWEIFLNSNRKVLSLLRPQLETIAELPTPSLRSRAASILGRIGEIDRFQVTFSLMREWINSKRRFQLATVGYLYQGIWASQNSDYREDCLRRLEAMATEEDRRRPEVWTAIAAYKQLGAYDPALAMRKFMEITKQKFAGTLEDTQRTEHILGRIEQALQDREKEIDEIDSMALSLYHDILREIAKQVFTQESVILLAVQYAIVALCLAGDTIQVFDELQKWSEADRESLGALVALIFLEHNGIASELESNTVEASEAAADGTVEIHRCNLLVLAIAANEDTVRRTARFLATVYDSFTNFFPRRSGSYFRKSFALHLKNLVDNALPVERLRLAIVHLFDELLTSPNQDLRDLVADILDEPDFDKEAKYYPFKRDLQRYRLNLDSRPFSLD